MIWGLLWFCADPKTDLAEKVARAADRYTVKFGRRPNLCYINPATLNGAAAGVEVNGVRLVSATNVLKHYFWIGGEEKRDQNCA